MTSPRKFLVLLISLLVIGAGIILFQELGPEDRSKAPRATSETPEHITPRVARGAEPIGPGGAYLRGTHWFGNAWAVNFWNTNLEAQAADDFERIREDGFNTVILVVPWPGFVDKATSGNLLSDRSLRLGRLIDTAADHQLNVVLRLSYAWDSAVVRSGQWLMRLWTEDTVYRAWVKHIAQLWDVVKDKDNVRFAFISWEDLWAAEGVGNSPAERRLQLAASLGYQDWLASFMSLEAVSERYGVRYGRFADIPVPERHEPAYGLYFDFIDYAWVERFFKPAQAVFPTLSMEVRIDSDPVWHAPGELAYWHSHELSWDLPGAPWTTVYWSPAMGGENRGETLDVETAAERLAYQMQRLRQVTGDRPIFIDQFLVEDFTPGFEMNGRLDSYDVSDFLVAAEPVLKELTHGYALWTWKDYLHNAIPSPDFFKTQSAWDGIAASQRIQGGAGYAMNAGQSLERAFGKHEFHAPGGPEAATLCVEAVQDGDPAEDLLIRSDPGNLTLRLDSSSAGEVCSELPVGPLTRVTIEALQDLTLEEITFSGFTQPIGIRDLEGRLKTIGSVWQWLNRALDVAHPLPFERYPDGWMGKTLHETIKRPLVAGEHALQLRTNLPADWPFTPTLTVTLNGHELGTIPCVDNQVHVLPILDSDDRQRNNQIVINADRTHRPGSDERRLGCLVSDLERTKNTATKTN